jgi:hypothetical protein
MRKVIVSEFLTLDGVMEASEQWQPPYASDDVAEAIRTGIHASEALPLGRVTYEIFAAYWPLQTDNESGIADSMWVQWSWPSVSSCWGWACSNDSCHAVARRRR